MLDILKRLEAANKRLKTAKIGVQIQQINNRLYLRATLPPKPNNGLSESFQQRISLGVQASLTGLDYAEAKAKEIGGLLSQHRFDWQFYMKILDPETEETIVLTSEWVERLEKDYFSKQQKKPTTLRTWDKDYYRILIL